MAIKQLSIIKQPKEIEKENEVKVMKQEVAKLKENLLLVSKEVLKNKGVL